MTQKKLNAGDQFHIVTYGRNPDIMPDLYITIPEAGVGALITAPNTLEIMMRGPETLAQIAQTLVLHAPDETPEEAGKAKLCAEHFSAEVGPLSQETIDQFPDLVCYTTSTADISLLMDVNEEAVLPAPAKPTGEGYSDSHH